MNIKPVLFIIASIITTNYTFSTTIKVDTLVLSKQKKITFLSDNHNESLVEKEQTGCLLDFFQERKESNTSLHILIEQASKLFNSSEFSIVFKLNENIEQAQPPLNNVTLQNIEIRYPAIIACGLLLSLAPENYDNRKEYIIDNSTKTVGSLNFQDILNNLDTVKQSLADYYLNHDDKVIANVYARHIVYSNDYYDSFKQTIDQLHSKHTSILEYTKKENGQKSSEGKALAKRIEIIFNPLLNLHILQNILESDHENILVFAGRTHTRDTISMLYELEANSIYRSEEYADKRPSTTLEIIEGLSAQPKTFTDTFCTVQ